MAQPPCISLSFSLTNPPFGGPLSLWCNSIEEMKNLKRPCWGWWSYRWSPTTIDGRLVAGLFCIWVVKNLTCTINSQAFDAMNSWLLVTPNSAKFQSSPSIQYLPFLSLYILLPWLRKFLPQKRRAFVTWRSQTTERKRKKPLPTTPFLGEPPAFHFQLVPSEENERKYPLKMDFVGKMIPSCHHELMKI